MRARALSLAMLAACTWLFTACAYDYSNVPRTDTPRVDGGGDPGSDAGSSVRCDPLAGTGCMMALACSASLDSERALTARCATLGPATEGVACTGPGVCGADLMCLQSAAGSGTCAYFCTGTTACPAGRECDRTDALFAIGGRIAYRCR